MKSSPACQHLVETEEGDHHEPYICPSGKWTVGIGHRLYPGDKIAGLSFDGKKWSGQISELQSNQIFLADIAKFELAVTNAVKVPLMQREFDALVSLAFNIGREAFTDSTLVKMLNAKKPRRNCAAQFARWNKGEDKQPLDGLTIRRARELCMFLGY